MSRIGPDPTEEQKQTKTSDLMQQLEDVASFQDDVENEMTKSNQKSKTQQQNSEKFVKEEEYATAREYQRSELKMENQQSLVELEQPSNPGQKEVEEEISLKDLRKMHQDNSLDNPFESAKDFMENMKYSVPLDSLYKVIASCQFQDGAEFCPVLVQIKDPEILKREKVENKFPFLLQVWTNYGDMVFERPLEKPVSNWNIANNKLVFMEESNSSQVWLVKLFMNKTPILFKFNLPDHVTYDQIGSIWDSQNQNFIIEEERPNDKNFLLQDSSVSTQRAPLISSGFDDQQSYLKQKQSISRNDDHNHMIKMGEIWNTHDSLASEQDHHKDGGDSHDEGSISQIFKNQPIIDRAPDKMIDYFQNFILIAFRHTLITINVSKLSIDEDDHDDERPVTIVDIESSQINSFDLDGKFKIIALQEIGHHQMTSIVLEDLETRQISFLRAQVPRENQTQKQVKFTQLGLYSNKILQHSPVLKFRSVSKLNPSTGKSFQVALAVRANGCVDFYSDFVLVNEYMNAKLQCVDIESAIDQFYLKFVRKSDTITSVNSIQDLGELFQIRQLRHSWRNRMSFSTTKINKDVGKQIWHQVLHKRISPFFKLYTSIQNFANFMLVSHRNMLSVYKMTSDGGKEGKWVQTMRFEGGFIREVMIKKQTPSKRRNFLIKAQTVILPDPQDPNTRSQFPDLIPRRIKSKKSGIIIDPLKSSNIDAQSLLPIFEQYEIISIIGTHTIKYCSLNHQGILTLQNKKDVGNIQNGRILNYNNDQNFRTGVLLLTDDTDDSEDYQEKEGCLVNTFPLKPNPGKKVELYTLKFKKLHKLMSSDEQKCLSADSTFSVQLQRYSVFPQGSKGIEGAKFSNVKDTVRVLICNSQSKLQTQIFLLEKTKRDKHLEKKVRLGDSIKINMDTNQGDNEDCESEDGIDAKKNLRSEIFDTFFTYDKEFKDNQGNMVEICRNEIKTMDKDCQPLRIFKGENIRCSLNVDQGYLYTINDNITKAPKTINFGEEQEEENEHEQAKDHYLTQSGFFVYDLKELQNGKIQKIRLQSAIGGQQSLINNSKFSNRISFLQSYDNIAVIPFPHLNLINFVGMNKKNEYLIWRAKNGFFTALDKRSQLSTWSTLTGKMLYSQSIQNDDIKFIKDYGVYQADENDISYTRDHYDEKLSSINLLKSKRCFEERDIDMFEKDSKLIRSSKLLKRQITSLNKHNSILKASNNLNQNLFTPKSNDQISCELGVKIQDQKQIRDLHHFMVMKLTTYEDHKEKDKYTEKKSEISVQFHFFFELLKTKKNKYEKFEWDFNCQPVQNLYLSRDTKLMMEVINNRVATIYYRVNVDNDGRTDQTNEIVDDVSQIVKWKVKSRLNKFPSQFARNTSVPYLFSPNFIYQLDVDVRAKQFTILDTDTQYQVLRIPRDLLTTSWNEKVGEDAIRIIMSRFKWVSDTTFRIVNEQNLDCLFELKPISGNKKTQLLNLSCGQKQPLEILSLELLSVVKVDNLHENMERIDSNHLFWERKTLQQSDVLERLIRNNQAYKTNLQHAINKNDKEFKIHQQFQKIDYSQPWSHNRSQFNSELSFTWLDWRMVETIIKNSKRKLEDFQAKERIQLCFNLFPGGQSMLHKLTMSQSQTGGARRKSTEQDQIESYESCKSLFDVTSTTQDLSITGTSECKFEIPILPDIYGMTVLDYCLGTKPIKSKIFGIEEQEENHLGNKPMAELIFTRLKDYGFMHSSFFITNSLIKAISQDNPAMLVYLNSRMLEVSHSFNQKSQFGLRKNIIIDSPAMGKYGRLISKIWTPEKKVQELLFDKEKSMQPMTLRYLDIPYIIGHTEFGDNFIDALLAAEDPTIFGKRSIQVIIDEHHKIWGNYNLWLIFFPMVLQLLVFAYWSNIIVDSLDLGYDVLEYQNTACLIILATTSIYFLINEICVIVRGFDKDLIVTNLFNLSVPTLILLTIFNYHNHHESWFWNLQILAALTNWLRVVLFLRYFEKFSWIIALTVKSFSDSYPFITIFVLGVFAFGDSTLSILNKIKEENNEPFEEKGDFYQQYLERYIFSLKTSFMVSVGDFGGLNIIEDQFDNFDFLVWLAAVIINIVVLLNLLIAIISNTFNDILTIKYESQYQEKTRQIRYIMNTIWSGKATQPDPTSLIFIAKVIKSHEDTGEDQKDQQEQIEDMSEKIDSIQQELVQVTKAQEEGRQEMLEQFGKLKDLIEKKNSEN